MSGPAGTISEVVDQLTGIVDRERDNGSQLGYFPALYRKVTIKVEEGIGDDLFDDGARMERLDVVFANRYLTALAQHRAGTPPTASWSYAFEVAGQWWPIVLQHLLLGMNAHINLDLGIAAARTAPGQALPSLRDDFNRINEILASLVGEVQDELAEVWPVLRVLNRYLGDVESAVINFSMEKARDKAWRVAEKLAPLTESEQVAEIARLDADVAAFARVIRYPGVVTSTVNKAIRLGERGSVARKIEILN